MSHMLDDATDDVILRNNAGGLLADVIPLNLTGRCSAAKGGGREAVREGWREGTRAISRFKKKMQSYFGKHRRWEEDN